jgi:hypothetical protein
MSLHLYNQYHFIPSLYLGLKQIVLLLNGRKNSSTQSLDTLKRSTDLVKQTKHYNPQKLFLDVQKLHNTLQMQSSAPLLIYSGFNLISTRPRQTNLEDYGSFESSNMPSMFINKYMPL